eukprot:TRINITY_DN4066_c0_g4_i1.p2 TRINITY_DN4066_c0_g4~~TRINITY_DN4066_c0_g4_i1.p2  ORF type:complete len:114 (-),score=13.31 TRINITY_DN4066_c0_g4_i1:522-863(-)
MYELCYLKKDENLKQEKYETLAERQNWTINKCLKNIKLREDEAVFYLAKKRNDFDFGFENLESNKVEAKDKEAITESKAKANIKKLTESTDLIEREKVLCTYHGVNVYLFNAL